MLYIVSTGCQWCALPHDFPPYTTVQGYFYTWLRERRWKAINHVLVMLSREQEGRETTPSVGILDSQSIKTAENVGPRGYDAGKKIKGRKRHIFRIATEPLWSQKKSGRSFPGFVVSSQTKDQQGRNCEKFWHE